MATRQRESVLNDEVGHRLGNKQVILHGKRVHLLISQSL